MPPGRYKIDKIRPEEKEVYLKFERPSALSIRVEAPGFLNIP